LALIDLDHFKTVNDRFGHPRGDEVLRVCAQVIRDTLRTDDHAARLGGEEFGVLLRGTAPAQAAALLEKLRLSIAAQSWAEDDLHVTASIGYAELRADDQSDARDALRRADAALYAVKASGRDQIQAG
jgi:diguanylate cyclase (GGDEF)-like protein